MFYFYVVYSFVTQVKSEPPKVGSFLINHPHDWFPLGRAHSVIAEKTGHRGIVITNRFRVQGEELEDILKSLPKDQT